MEECEEDSVESVSNEVITVVENNGVLSNFVEPSLLVELENEGVLADTVDSFSFVDLSFVIVIVEWLFVEYPIFVVSLVVVETLFVERFFVFVKIVEKITSVVEVEIDDEVMEECEVRYEVITVVKEEGVLSNFDKPFDVAKYEDEGISEDCFIVTDICSVDDDLVLFVDFDELILIAVSNFVEYFDVEDMKELFVLVKVFSYWVDKSTLELEIVEVAVFLFTLVMVTVISVLKADSIDDDLMLVVDFKELILIAVSNFVEYFDVEDMTELIVLVKVLSYWVDKSNLELEIVEAAVVFFKLVMVTVIPVLKADSLDDD